MLLICEIAQYIQTSELKKEHTFSFETQCLFFFFFTVFTDWYIELTFVFFSVDVDIKVSVHKYNSQKAKHKRKAKMKSNRIATFPFSPQDRSVGAAFPSISVLFVLPFFHSSLFLFFLLTSSCGLTVSCQKMSTALLRVLESFLSK